MACAIEGDTLVYSGDIDYDFLVQLQRFVLAGGAERKTLFLCSTGGLSHVGLAAQEFVRPLRVVASGCALSSALHIVASARIRLATPWTQFMLHEAGLELSDRHSLSEVQSEVKDLLSIEDAFLTTLGTRTRRGAGWWVRQMKAHAGAFYFNTTEAHRYGVIDGIFRPGKDQ